MILTMRSSMRSGMVMSSVRTICTCTVIHRQQVASPSAVCSQPSFSFVSPAVCQIHAERTQPGSAPTSLVENRTRPQHHHFYSEPSKVLVHHHLIIFSADSSSSSCLPMQLRHFEQLYWRGPSLPLGEKERGQDGCPLHLLILISLCDESRKDCTVPYGSYQLRSSSPRFLANVS